MRGRIVAQLILAVLAAGCSGSTGKDYTSQEGRYRVRFGGEPKRQEQMVPTQFGPIALKVMVIEDWTGTARVVKYADYPSHVQFVDREAGLDGACQGFLKESHLKGLSKKPVSLNGHPGREVSFETQPGGSGPNLAGRARFYLVGNRLYEVVIAGRSALIGSGTMDEFLDSFALLDPGAAPAETRIATGSPPRNFPAPGSPSNQRPNPVPDPAPAPNSGFGRVARPPDPPDSPEPSRAPDSGEMLAFYNIPEPASTAIEADSSETGSTLASAPPSSLLMPDTPGSRPAAESPFRRVPRSHPDGPGIGAQQGSSESPFRRVPRPRNDDDDDDESPSESPFRRVPRPRNDAATPAPLGPRDRAATEIPTLLMPSSGGATIVSFDWLDRNDDYASTEGRMIAAGGGKDEHYRLVMDLPPATIVEEVAILGGPVRWTTKPLPRSWPIAVVSNQQLKNRRQSLRLGGFSGRWTFDLYAESHESIRSGQDFGVEVVLAIRGTRHHLTARCQRK